MSKQDHNTDLDALDARIKELKSKGEETPTEDHYSQANQGWRMVTELVAGLMLGVGAGYGLDRLFGTIPIFLVLCTLFGFAAGVNVMLRTAKEFEKSKAADEAAQNEGSDSNG